jgi:PhnB protein
MATQLNCYIGFKDTARPAMEFYRDVFGGELSVNTFGEFGGEASDLIMHARLETPSGYTIMAADTPPGQEFATGSQITMSLSGDDADELRGYWDALAADGSVAMPLEKQVWGDTFGMLTDKWGIDWMVNITEG